MTSNPVPEVTIGYCCKDNDQGNKPYPVLMRQLTNEQLTIMKAHDTLTAYQMAFDDVEKKMRPYLDACRHEVFWDQDDGYMYHNRYCVLCGRGMGVI